MNNEEYIEYNYLEDFKLDKKYTDYISYNSAINLLHTFDYAKFCGKPLNLAVTINFYEDYSAPEKFKNIRRKLFRWLKTRRRKLGYPQDQFWAFTIENPHDNVHVHLACHVEDEFQQEFKAKIQILVKNVALKTKNSQLHFENIDILTDKKFANYMIKGVHPDTAKHLYIEDICEYQGRIFGQRARSCMKLSRTARKRADFHATIHRHLWRLRHPNLVAGRSLANWDESKVIPNATFIRTIDEMFDNFADESQNLLDSGLKTKPTRRWKRRTASTATMLGSTQRIGLEARNRRSRAASRRNNAIPALTAGKHF